MTLRSRRLNVNHFEFPVERPKVDAFLADIFAVYEKHGMAISHEDCHGGFEIVRNDADHRQWLDAALDETEYDDSVKWKPKNGYGR